MGLIAGLTAFASIWLGHGFVRKIEAHAVRLWIPMAATFLFGAAFEAVALIVSPPAISMVFGILGITLFWDVLELKRQAVRVSKGHAPANPANPRHAALLAQPGSAATTCKVPERKPGEGRISTDIQGHKTTGVRL